MVELMVALKDSMTAAHSADAWAAWMVAYSAYSKVVRKVVTTVVYSEL